MEWPPPLAWFLLACYLGIGLLTGAVIVLTVEEVRGLCREFLEWWERRKP